MTEASASVCLLLATALNALCNAMQHYAVMALHGTGDGVRSEAVRYWCSAVEYGAIYCSVVQ